MVVGKESYDWDEFEQVIFVLKQILAMDWDIVNRMNYEIHKKLKHTSEQLYLEYFTKILCDIYIYHFWHFIKEFGVLIFFL